MVDKKIDLLTIELENGKTVEVEEGKTLLELSREFQEEFKFDIVAAKVDYDIKELSYKIMSNCRIEFLDTSNSDGMRFYRRSLTLVLIKAKNELFPKRSVVINNTVGSGVFFEINGEEKLTEEDVINLEKKMKGIISEKIPFVKKTLSIEEAEKVLMDCGRVDRCKGLEHRTKPYITVYNCDGFEDYFYGYMVPDTSYLKVFKLMFYRHGLILVFPHKKEPSKLRKYVEQKKLFNVFSEHKKWGRILGVSNVADLNCIVKNGNVSDFIRVSEALHEKKIAKIADMICEEKHEKRVVLISGPSSSGKTTFAQRLSIQLRVNGVRPKTISLDNYFLDRKDTPLDQNGDYDFECIEAIDTELFNKHLAGLIEGKEILVPVFNFKKGCREEKRNKLKIDKDQMLIIEGIHGLNEKLSASVHRDKKFKIYVSALTSLNIDEHNRIPTTDTRFIRRIVRDFQFRGSSATNTIQMWPSVRRGEERNIFPFQEDADIMFNTALIYELGVLKSIAENLLVDVSRYSKEYSEAKRLIEFLRNFVHIDPKDVPMNSLLREFVGDGCFR